MSVEIEALKHFFAAINRNDLQAITRDLDPAIVRIEPEGFPTAGTYRGIPEVHAHVEKGRGSWAEGSTEWIDGRFADGFLFRDGRIVEYRTFAEREAARAWAGIEG